MYYVKTEEPLEDLSLGFERLMDWSGHIAFFLAVAMLFGFDPVRILPYAVFAIFPDMDHPWSTRKAFHNIFFALLIPYPFVRGGLVSMPSLAVGAVMSHLVWDSLTPSGVEFFYPFPLLRINGPRWFKSGLRAGFVGIIIFAIVYLFVRSRVIL